MGVFKEEASSFDQIIKNSSLVYSDAADTGVTYNTANIPNDVAEVINSVKTFQNLDKRFKDECDHSPMIVDRWENKNQVSVKIRILWERGYGIEYGSYYNISYASLKGDNSRLDKDANAMLSVSHERFNEIY